MQLYVWVRRQQTIVTQCSTRFLFSSSPFWRIIIIVETLNVLFALYYAIVNGKKCLPRCVRYEEFHICVFDYETESLFDSRNTYIHVARYMSFISHAGAPFAFLGIDVGLVFGSTLDPHTENTVFYYYAHDCKYRNDWTENIKVDMCCVLLCVCVYIYYSD